MSITPKQVDLKLLFVVQMQPVHSSSVQSVLQLKILGSDIWSAEVPLSKNPYQYSGRAVLYHKWCFDDPLEEDANLNLNFLQRS